MNLSAETDFELEFLISDFSKIYKNGFFIEIAWFENFSYILFRKWSPIEWELLPNFQKFWGDSQKILRKWPKTIFSVHNMLHTENVAWGLMKWGVKWIEFWGHWFIESKHFWTTVDTPITGIIQFPFYMFLRVKFKLIHQSDPWGVNLTSLDFFLSEMNSILENYDKIWFRNSIYLIFELTV